MKYDLSKSITINGSTMQLEEFVTKHCKDPAHAEDVIDALMKAGAMTYAVPVLTVQDVLAQEETQGAEAEKVFGYVEMDLDNVKLAQDMVKLAKESSIMYELEVVDPIKQTYMLKMVDVPARALTKFKRCIFISTAANTVSVASEAAANTMLNTVDFTAEHVAKPLTRSVIRAGIGLAKVAGKFIYATGSTVIADVPKAFREGKRELDCDADTIAAGKEITKAKNYVMGKINGPGTGSKIRVG